MPPRNDVLSTCSNSTEKLTRSVLASSEVCRWELFYLRLSSKGEDASSPLPLMSAERRAVATPLSNNFLLLRLARSTKRRLFSSAGER